MDTAAENAERAFVALKAGDFDAARKYLAGSNPSNGFSMYVKAAFTPDAVEAADIYKEIVAENHGRPIAGEALLQLYKYHYAVGDYAAAHTDFLSLKKYPLIPPVSDPAGLEDSTRGISAGTQPAQEPVRSEPIQQVEAAEYIVQLGVFTTSDNAHKFVDDLDANGIEASVFIKDSGGRALYGVSAGTFDNRDDAEKLAADLKNKSINCIVVKK